MIHIQLRRAGIVMLFLSFCFHGIDQAWSQSGNEIIEGAKEEGELVIYGSTDLRQANIIASKFREKYPFIDVKLTRLTSNKLYPRVQAEARAGKFLADILQNNTVGLYFLKKGGFLEHYPSSAERFYPDRFKEPGYWTITSMNVHVLAYNTNKVSRDKLPKTYQNLLDPFWKGKLMLNPREHWFAWMLQVMGKEQGLAYMRKLAGQNLAVRHESTSMRAQLISAGEAAMDIDSSYSTVNALIKKGAPLAWFTLDPVFVVPTGHGIAIRAPHPNAAKLFMDFMLSQHGQRVVLTLDRYSIRSDLMQEQLAIKDLNLVPPDPAMGEDMEYFAKQAEEIFIK
ncbi:MAG: ABC transporter substrate-binding protein [Candidatus Binatia bacterium]